MTVKVEVELDIIPIVELLCANFECGYNLIHNISYGSARCQFKCVEINNDGKCIYANDKYKELNQ